MLSLDPKPSPAAEQFQKFKRNSVVKRATKILIIAPTRELGVQITNEAEKFARVTSLKTICLYGGVSRSAQIDILHRQGKSVMFISHFYSLFITLNTIVMTCIYVFIQ